MKPLALGILTALISFHAHAADSTWLVCDNGAVDFAKQTVALKGNLNSNGNNIHFDTVMNCKELDANRN